MASKRDSRIDRYVEIVGSLALPMLMRTVNRNILFTHGHQQDHDTRYMEYEGKPGDSRQ